MMPDVMKIGVTGWLRAAALGEAHGIRLSNHLWPEISAQLLSVTPTAHWLEYADWWNPIVAEPLRIENDTARWKARSRAASSGTRRRSENICVSGPSRLSVTVPHERPVRAAAGFNGSEIVPFEGVLIFGKIDFPERKEILSNVQTFLASAGTIQEFMASINAGLAKLLGDLGEVIKMNHWRSFRGHTGIES
jgi:hypothetical protein